MELTTTKLQTLRRETEDDLYDLRTAMATELDNAGSMAGTLHWDDNANRVAVLTNLRTALLAAESELREDA